MTPKIIFQFNREEDLKNIWETCNLKSKSYGYDFKKSVTKNILRLCEGKKYEAIKLQLKKSLEDIHKNILCNEIVSSFNNGWKKIEEEYFKRLKKIIKEKIYFKKIDAYLTTAGRCPYYPDQKTPHFFVSFFANIPWAMQTAGHEIMHIYFHNSKYWKISERELGIEKAHNLKEALTVLLNLEFSDLWTKEDRGYDSHTKLRKFISNSWKKEKDFDKLVNNSIKWIKEKG